MDKTFELKVCELRLVDPKMEEYYFDLLALRDASKVMEDQEQSSLAQIYLDFIYDMANTYLMPLSDDQLDEALLKCKEFYATHKNSATQHQIFACGHCHIDTAWLWPYAETKRKIARSWASQLEHINNIFKGQGLRFSATSAAHYWWLQQNYPEVYQRVKEAVKDGTFEVVGGTWVEFDGNIPSGESMTRQFLYG